MKNIFSLVLTVGLFASTAFAAESEILKDFDSLSGNDVLMDRANQLAPDVRTQIVQKRAVTRPGRFEFSPGYTTTFGGDAYVKTTAVGLQANYHLNYKWAVGVRYDYAFNELSKEGKDLIDNPPAAYDDDGNFIGYGANVPALDYMKSSTLGLISWYPIYGKFSFFDQGVVHFDLYAIAGAGQVALRSGGKSAVTAGAGVAFWFSQHLTARVESRWLNYEAEPLPGMTKDMDVTTGQVSVGYLL